MPRKVALRHSLQYMEMSLGLAIGYTLMALVFLAGGMLTGWTNPAGWMCLIGLSTATAIPLWAAFIFFNRKVSRLI